METGVFTVLIALVVILLFYASHLWDRVNYLEDELERVTNYGSR